MDLPESVAAIGERLGGTARSWPTRNCCTARTCLPPSATELFLRPWVAVDHQTRLDGDGCYFRFDAATRSLLVTLHRGRRPACAAQCLHPCRLPGLRGRGRHGRTADLPVSWLGIRSSTAGWSNPNLSARIDPARLRLARHPVCVHDGLIFVDPSGAAVAGEAAVDPVAAGVVPEWLAEGSVTGRGRYTTNWNWKLALQFLKASPHLFADDADDGATCVVFGPLSLMMVQPQHAALLRVIPKSAVRTDIQLVRMEAKGAPPSTPVADGPDRVADGLERAGDAEAVARSVELDRSFSPGTGR